MRRLLGVGIITVLVGLTVSPTPGVGQESSEDGTAHKRSGFWFNGGLGYGSLGCDDCTDREGGLVGTLSFGGTLSQKVLLSGSTYGWTKEESGVRLTTNAVTASLRFYPSETGGFYLLGGLGFGTVDLDVSGFGSASETGAAAVLGLGVDIRVSDNVSLTPYLHGVGISFDDGDANFNQLGLSITTH